MKRGEYEGQIVSPALAEGLTAYAKDQAQILQDIASKFTDRWAILRRDDITNEELEGLAPPAKKRKDDEGEV